MTDQLKDGGPAPTRKEPITDDWSLRDWFAGQAICGAAGPAVDGWSISPGDQARWAYEIADAMLEARK